MLRAEFAIKLEVGLINWIEELCSSLQTTCKNSKCASILKYVTSRTDPVRMCKNNPILHVHSENNCTVSAQCRQTILKQWPQQPCVNFVGFWEWVGRLVKTMVESWALVLFSLVPCILAFHNILMQWPNPYPMIFILYLQNLLSKALKMCSTSAKPREIFFGGCTF